MPSPIAHSVAGYLLSRHPIVQHHLPQRLRGFAPLAALYGVMVSNLPDFDFIPQVVTGLRFHRGPSHSLLAVVLISSLLALIVQRIWKQKNYTALIGITGSFYLCHLLLDFFTAGGDGMALLWPLSEQNFISPLPLFPPVHHSRGLWDKSHLVFIGVELLYSLVILGGCKLLPPRNPRQRPTTPQN